MDRFRWCTDSLELCFPETNVLQQSGVRLYNGKNRTSFEDGIIQLTSHRLIWSTPDRASSAIALPLLVVSNVQEEHEGRRSTPKIALQLLSVSALKTAFEAVPTHPAWAADWIVDRDPGKRVAIAAGIDFIRLGFTRGETSEFARAISTTINAKMWMVPTTGTSAGIGGIARIERIEAVKSNQADLAISDAFTDLSQLMARAKDMVALSHSLAQRIRQTKNNGEDANEDETVELRRAMMSIGLNEEDDIVEANIPDANSFHEQLAIQCCRLLTPLLTAKAASVRGHNMEGAGGCIDLPSAYCRINRAKGVELISPEDLLTAAKLMERLQLPLRLKKFPSGVMILQLATETDAATLEATRRLVKKATVDKRVGEGGGLSAGELARMVGIAPLLARERLLQVEASGLVCRDESDSGIKFYPNLFSTCSS